MLRQSNTHSNPRFRFTLTALIARFAILTLGLLAVSGAHAVTVDVVDNDGNAVDGFRWILQQDTTFPVDPNNPSTNPDDLLSMGFHASYHPVAQTGNVDTGPATITAPAGRYYVSVLPYEGYSISGQPMEVVNGSETVTVTVQQHPIPTAQIALYLFHDNYPINGAPDLPEEANPLPGDPGHVDWTQFDIQVEEPAGRYGIAGGQVIQDAFGNPLGTSYIQTCDATGANPGTGDYGCFDPITGEAVVDVLGDGTLQPLADGTLLIENLAPGKYGIIVIPPTGSNWQQTSTIEGSKVIDAWVKANEPAFFVEFGPPGPHVFVGFLKSTADGGFPPISQPPGTTTTGTLTGTITNMHLSRSPETQMFSGHAFPQCWVGLNDNNAGLGAGLFAAPCDGDSNFSIPNVPPGNYQLKVFDANLDVVIATLGVTVDENGNCPGAATGCDYGDVPVFSWFTRLNTGVFNDANQNGFWDTGEGGILENQDVTLRWRDGTIYQNFPTDTEGLAPFDEVFPFFHWLVAEVSFASKKATGATIVVDAGGFVDTSTDAFPGFGELAPQPQVCTDAQATNPDDPDFGCTVGADIINPNTSNNLSRTELGPVLTQGTQGFLGQTSVMQFGKTDYISFDFSSFPPTYVGENGGISGLVYYATTRAEDEPQFAAAEEWEPGIPRVQVNLYADGDIDSFPLGDFPGIGDVDWNGNGIRELDDGVIDDINGVAGIALADVDNYPFGWSEGGTMGPEDVENSGTDGVFDLGDAVQVTWTDSWDDSLPTGCQGANNLSIDLDNDGTIDGISDDRCFDGLRNFNQVRPGVFDGGYAFVDYDLDHLGLVNANAATAIQNFYDAITNPVTGVPDAELLQLGLIPGDYIVEAATPPGYKLMKEEDKNVDFGDDYIPSPQALAVPCVGDDRVVPPYLSMTTKDGTGADTVGNLISGIDPLDAEAPFAGDLRPLCDRKKVSLSSAQNAAAEFFMMTDVPVAANVSGVMLNDLANEFNPNSPAFGEKFAPPLLPVGFYDFNGKLVNKVYGDNYGRFNAVLPSTFTANLPQPSGMSPNMLISCMNDAGAVPNPDPNGPSFILDPFYDPQYSQFCYTFQYMPGAITYLDTPVVPVAAFTTPGANPVDCERPTRTPMIASVTRWPASDGPFVVAGADQRIRVRSMGFIEVPNPEWDGVVLANKTKQRDYRFTTGNLEVFLEAADGTRYELDDNTGPSNGNRNQQTRTVQADVPAGDYQVVVVTTSGTAAGTETPIGVTLTVGTAEDTGLRPDGGSYAVHRVAGPAPYPATPIQDTIDAAASGDLILVPPGSYDELVIMSKPVKLQGWGAGEVFLNARQVPTEKVIGWREKAAGLIAGGTISQLPGQELGPLGGFPALAEAVFPTEEGAAIFVAGVDSGPNRFVRLANRFARIDGFTILGASTGGGIVVNGYSQYLQIGNNRLTGNAGAFGGGIRVGHPQLAHQDPATGELVYDDALNDNIRIHHNHVVKNGGFGGAGGGLSLHTGADNYDVHNNWVCGNFTQGDGAGIGHLGLSRGGLIEDNYILFNESFAQAGPQSGGGIFIGGQPGLEGPISPGSGNVTIDANLIRGNLAGAGDGGGIRLAAINGEDIEDNLGARNQWYRVNIFNNMINNNVAGLAGGGISLSDALRVNIRNNTVANNESTATTAEAFDPGVINVTTAQPAGIVSRQHSNDMLFLMADAAIADPSLPADWLTFADPVLRSNIVLHNRSFYWTNFDDPGTVTIETGLVPATCDTPMAPVGNPNCDVASAVLDDFSFDLAVLSALEPTALLNPRFSLLTDTTGYAGNNTESLCDSTTDPHCDFVKGYFNGARDNLNIPEFTTLQTAGAFDEGGNFIQVTFGPLSLIEPDNNPTNNERPPFDYHLDGASVAINNGGGVPASGRLTEDFDNDDRGPTDTDIGADELVN